MIIDYHIIQYVADPLRGESRNIGVIARSGRQAAYRTIGTQPEGVNLWFYKSLCDGKGIDIWAFAEWDEWFQALVTDEVLDPERFDAILSDLEPSGKIITMKGGILEAPDKSPLEETIDFLFRKLVTVPPLPKQHKFKERLEQVLREAEVSFRHDFLRDVEVEFQTAGGVPETVGLWGVLENRPRTVFKVVRLKTGRDLIRQVNDTLYTFQKVVEHGFAAKERCVILAEGPPTGKDSYARRLAEAACLIDITNTIAVSTLRSIVQKGNTT